MADQYKWAEGSRIKKGLSAQTVGEFLQDLNQANGGSLTPSEIIESAKPTDSPIHSAFEWNDSSAAFEHRLWQARVLIKSVRIVFEDEPGGKERRLFLNVRQEGLGPAYMTSMKVFSDSDLREQALNKALSDLEAWRQRHNDLTELSELFRVVDQFLQSSAPLTASSMAAKGA